MMQQNDLNKSEINEELLQLNIDKAVRRIETLYKQAEGQVALSFSGGKDSTICLALIKICEDRNLIPKNSIPAVFVDTKIELDAIVDFVRWVKENYYPNVVFLKTEKPFSQVIKEHGKPFRSKLLSKMLWYYKMQPQGKTAQYLTEQSDRYSSLRLGYKYYHVLHPDFNIIFSDKCCEEMKKKPFKKYDKENHIKGKLIGIRAFEGGARELIYKNALKKGKSPCTTVKNGVIQKAPIIDWSDEICEAFIKKYNVPLARAYTEYGMNRTGCFLCPFRNNLSEELEMLNKYEPSKYKAAMFFLKDVYIALGAKLPFDKEYMEEYEKKWKEYEPMRYEMLKKYKPNCQIVKSYEKKVLNKK